MSGNFIYHHHVEPRVKLYSPREESFPIPLKYIDLSRATHTNLDVKQEKRIDDYWNIDRSKDLSDSWTCITQSSLLEERPPDACMWSGRETDKTAGNFHGQNSASKLRMLEDYEEFISLTLRTRSSKKPLRMQEEIGNTNRSRYALQDKQEEQE